MITDSNRRRVLVTSRLAQNAGPVLAADETPSVDAAVLNPFPEQGSDAQTVAVYEGIKGVSAPSSPGFPQFPEHRPFAALDGDPATHWQADRALTADLHTLDVTFERPRDVPYVDLLPYDDARAKVVAVEIAGRRYPVHRGWNRLPLGLREASEPAGAAGRSAAAPSRRRPPASASSRSPASRRPRRCARRCWPSRRSRAGSRTTGLTYVFQRTTGDDPFRRDPWHGSSSAALVRDRGDAERGLERIIAPPAARDWNMSGWVTVAPDAPDAAIDALVGVKGAFNSSARFEGRPGFRASSAFDGTTRPWIGSWQAGHRTWLEWESEPTTLAEPDARPGARRAAADAGPPEAGDRRSPPLASLPTASVRLHSRCAGGASGWRSSAPPSRPGPGERSVSGARSGSPRCAGPECRPSRCRAPTRSATAARDSP